MEAKLPVRVFRVFRGSPFYWEGWGLTNPAGIDFEQGLTRRRGDAERKQRGNFISAQFWGEPDEGRNGVVNGLPNKNLCVFASWREAKSSNNGNSRKDAETLRY